jgi:uncharacterized protein (TIGR03086 family)
MHINLPDIVALDARAVRHSIDVVRQVRRTDLDRPTPCAGWTLADLLTHMTAQHRGFTAAAAGVGHNLSHWSTTPPHDNPAHRSATPPDDNPAHQSAAPPDDDLVAGYLWAADAVVAAFADSPAPEFALPEISTDRTFPAATAVAFHFIDYVVHSWDVAAALGTTYDPEPDLLGAALPVALAVPGGEQRLAPGSAFRPALPATGDAGTLDRILAALGRAPDWTPGHRSLVAGHRSNTPSRRSATPAAGPPQPLAGTAAVKRTRP